MLIGTSCSQPPELVSKAELLELTESWKEPKVAIWHYWGSDDEYDFFLFQDIDGKKAYRVKKEEGMIEDEFEVTSNTKTWRVMPWGPQAVMNHRSSRATQ